MSIIKLRAKISKKKPIEKLNDEKLSDTVGGTPPCAYGGYTFAELYSPCHNKNAVSRPGALKPLECGGNAIVLLHASKKGNTGDPRLGRLIGYCADCKCPVYSVTRKNHAGHNVITGAGR